MLGLEAGLAQLVRLLGSEDEARAFCSGSSVPASQLEDILEEAAGRAAGVALVLVSAEGVHCSVVLVHSRVLPVVPASVERCSPFLSQDEGHIPLSLSYASALDSRSYSVHACPLRHKNGCDHAFDRVSGDAHASVFAHENACVHESVYVGWAGVTRLLAEDMIAPREWNVLSCSSGAGGEGSLRLPARGRQG